MKNYIERLKDAVQQVTLLKKEVMGNYLSISDKKEILERAQEISSNKSLKPPVIFEDTENYCHFSEEPPETEEDKLRLSLEEKLMALTDDIDERIILDSGFYEKADGEDTVKALVLKDYNVDEETAKTFSVGDVFMAINGQWMIKVGAEDYRAWTWTS
tara:strand:+ start:172 stop:645 length:474 start_codon:yes stop_codon:yes gene_type:complete